MSAKQFPLLMRPELVRATLAGLKTVTRRLDLRWLQAQPGDLIWVKETWRTTAGLDGLSPVAIAKAAKEAGYSPWAPIEYVADGHRDNWEPNFHRTPEEMKPGRTRVSIHMPKWASRLWLEVASVREEALQDIAEEDALREGVEPTFFREAWSVLRKDGGGYECFVEPTPSDDIVAFVHMPAKVLSTARDVFARLWDQINPGKPWAANPRLARIEFKRVDRPTLEASCSR